jgi:hypothetical protein
MQASRNLTPRPLLLASIAGVLMVSACAPLSSSLNSADSAHPEARAYDASIDASASVDAGLARAKASGRHVILVLGANWCHDSRAFAGWMETERFQSLLKDRFELVYVNVGMPQTKDGHNLHIAERFSVTDIEGTPSVLVLSSDGVLLNGESAKSWRNAASRTQDAIFAELVALAPEG